MKHEWDSFLIFYYETAILNKKYQEPSLHHQTTRTPPEKRLTPLTTKSRIHTQRQHVHQKESENTPHTHKRKETK